jgi:transposase
MRLQTLLNHVEKFKSFVYGPVTKEERAESDVLLVRVRPRKGSRPVCSGCGGRGPVHDRLEDREFEYVPFWGFLVFFVYRMRRVNCRSCGVKVERVPWCDGKQQMTITYRWYLTKWAKRLSWTEVATIFQTSWNSVCRAVEHAVEWGRKRRRLDDVTAIGVDEIAWRRGHTYLTLVYDIGSETKRLLAVAEERTEVSLRSCLDELGEACCRQLKFIASDMWQPYLKVLAERAGQAIHVLDRFHIMQKFGKAIDEIRAEETKRLKRDGYEPVLTKSRWCLLKRPENLTDKQSLRLTELLQYNLKAVRAYLLKEEFQQFWEYVSPKWAEKFLDEWTAKVMRSRLAPLKKVARTLRGHRDLILNWFKAKGQISSGAVEGLNNQAKLVSRKSHGFRTSRVAELALLHQLGNLPEKQITHRFC